MQWAFQYENTSMTGAMLFTMCLNSLWVETFKFVILGLEFCLFLLLLLVHPMLLICGFSSSSHTFRGFKFAILLPYNILVNQLLYLIQFGQHFLICYHFGRAFFRLRLFWNRFQWNFVCNISIWMLVEN